MENQQNRKELEGWKAGHTGGCQEASLEEVAGVGGRPTTVPFAPRWRRADSVQPVTATPSEGRVTPVLRASVLGDTSSPPEASVRALGALARPAFVVDVC